MRDHCLYGSKGRKTRNSALRVFLTNDKTQSSQLMSKIEDTSNASKEKS